MNLVQIEMNYSYIVAYQQFLLSNINENQVDLEKFTIDSKDNIRRTHLVENQIIFQIAALLTQRIGE